MTSPYPASDRNAVAEQGSVTPHAERIAPEIPGPDDQPFGNSLEGRMLFWTAILFSVFQILTAAHLVDLPSQLVRVIHVAFACFLAFPLHRATRGLGRGWAAIAWACAFLAVVVALYQTTQYEALIIRAGLPTTMDVVVGVVLLMTVFAASWIVMGPALPLICAVFLAYAIWGEYLLRPLDHRPFPFSQIIDHLTFGTEGIYGTPIYVSSSYIFLFILFGSFLERAGMIRLFTDVSLGLVGHRTGGPAKVAVIASGLMGTISGSGVANVVTTGQFTIRLMKRFGYSPAFAGGVESTASMGGQIMPPVMGAVAFIMAETLGIQYAQVVLAAVIPAVFYFGSAFWIVHLEARRLGLTGLSEAERPSALAAVRREWFLLLPLAVLVYLLFAGFTPLFAGLVGLTMTLVVILGTAAAVGLSSTVLRFIYWIAIGAGCAAFLEFGLYPVLGLLGLLAAWNLTHSSGRQTLIACRDALAGGARTALPVAVACAMVGVIIGVLSLTGAATTFSRFIVAVGNQSLILSLILTMITCIILGMGIPTIPNYIITSSIAGPALLELGVPLIVSHMFVFYFGILADLTPPVALACFAAAPIAKENGLKISVQAIKVAAAGFVMPYIAVYSPALMLQDGGPLAESIGYIPAVAVVIAKTAAAVFLWGAAIIGFLGRTLTWPERVLAVLGAIAFVTAGMLSNAIGFLLLAGFLLSALRRTPATVRKGRVS
ncbi:TRAP transporter permease [Puniceibacterium sp. IMCC21224]|uniref:TRAP transporter permease n=1 Tax=Puniceibacterium sp. IMCC21224 TaxID=1618204 RepID=UPI00065D6A09|nr:TRAP transporter permease [Puniceibacterium sp. IMCC21224]KMK69037.1 TRAP transporter, 4TM/12TM fusion protein [Puniceibacterium sp. IMCC21224]